MWFATGLSVTNSREYTLLMQANRFFVAIVFCVLLQNCISILTSCITKVYSGSQTLCTTSACSSRCGFRHSAVRLSLQHWVCQALQASPTSLHAASYDLVFQYILVLFFFFFFLSLSFYLFKFFPRLELSASRVHTLFLVPLSWCDVWRVLLWWPGSSCHILVVWSVPCSEGLGTAATHD